MMEESGSRAGSESGSIPLTNGPDPGGPKTCGTGGSGFWSGTATVVNEVP